MSMGIGNFTYGASGTLVMIQMLPLHARLRIRIAQAFIVLLGGTWALFPDSSKHTQRLEFINVRYLTKLGIPNLDMFINFLSVFTILVGQTYPFCIVPLILLRYR